MLQHLELDVTDSSGHTEAVFEEKEIRVTFAKTTPEERGLIDSLIADAKAEGMVLHTVAKDGERKAVEADAVLDQLFMSKNEIALTGTAEAVEKLAFDRVKKEIRGGRTVMHATDGGEWKFIRSEKEFKPSGDKKEKVVSLEVPRAG
jgi:hypothetical protein